MSDDAGKSIDVRFGNVERTGPWIVPAELDVRVRFGNAELDLREATLAPGTTTIRVDVKFGNVELFVPDDLPVDVDVATVGGNVSGGGAAKLALPHGEGAYRIAEPMPPPSRVRVVGKVTAGNCEVVAFAHGESRAEALRRMHRQRRHQRWKHVHAERQMWMQAGARQRWMPWWLMARVRRRMFSWLAIAFAAGTLFGVYGWDHARWWHIAVAAVVLGIMSGAVAWRMSRPLLVAISAARDIGDGKLDTRVDARHQRGEMYVLATALNEMASKIQQQITDQRQLLAAVSHELRTPLGHMRVLIETARDAKDGKTLDELEREVIVLDELVGKLLASSRLEFGNLDKRDIDLGALVADVAHAAGVSTDAIEAVGEVRAAVDPTLVRRALANLLDNARTHGGGAIAVRIERRAAQIAIEVDDAGPGVPADRRADAFRAFVPSRAGGLGLGLALVSRIAVAHGGGAWIAERPGGGARVGFTVAVA